MPVTLSKKMEHTKSKYLIWLETLHREYTDQTNITLFGKQAMLIKLLADTHEVKCRFENILTKLQTKKLLLEEDDIEYKEWYDPNKWKINSKMLVDHDVAETLGINNKDNVINTYPNKLIEAFEDDSKIDNNRFNLLVSLLYVFDTIVDEQAICVAIDNEVKQLQLILLNIENEKNKEKSNEEYAEYFNKKKGEYLNFLMKSNIEGEHAKWKKSIYDDDKIYALKERRAELVLNIFDSLFLDGLKTKNHRKTKDDIFGFKDYSFEKWKNREEEALVYFVCLTKLCPFKDDMLDFSNHAKIGRYIYEEHIEKPMVNDFLKNMQLIILVQEEMKALNAQNKVEEGDKDEPASELDRDKKIKQAILQMQEEKLFKKKYDYTWIMLFMKEVNKNKDNQDYKYKYLDLPTFNSSQSFVDYLNTLGLSDLPSDKSINNKQNTTKGSFRWTFTDKDDEGEKNRRNYIVTRFISYYNTGK